MSLTPELRARAANIRECRRVAARNLRAARILRRQGDGRAARMIETYHSSKRRHGDLYPNPDRRAALLGCAGALRVTLADLEAQRPTPEAPPEYLAICTTLKASIEAYGALADAARF